MIVEVNMVEYDKLKGIPREYCRCLDPSHDYQEMEVTPEELKWLLDNCVDIRTINKEQ